ncbi:30S ribosomal protein S3 [Candidatus Woesearchaeota archaeon]|nr:30S ribosomal protein S3 [Candidatus Woesearchaeota archaeon]
MIEREFIAQKTKEFYIKKFVRERLKNAGISQVTLKKIPLGEKIIVHASRPSVIVGSKGGNIRDLTKMLKQEFKLENPQIEITEVKDIFLDPVIVAERIASSLERFGSARFKGIGHKVMQNVLGAGALGVEIIISGKIPGARAKSWRFYQGYLKKCGDVAVVGVRHARASAVLKTGVIGIKVSIMPRDLILPDHIDILPEPVEQIEAITEAAGALDEDQAKKASPKKRAPAKKKTSSEKTDKADKKAPPRKTTNTKASASPENANENAELKGEEA